MKITQKYINDLSYKIIGCAIEVHKNLGPGLLESVYEECFVFELEKAGLQVSFQKYVPVIYKGKQLKSQLKYDILVNDIIMIENKAVELMHSLYQAQLLTYLKLTDKPKGLLINFNTEVLKNGIISLVIAKFSKLSKE